MPSTPLPGRKNVFISYRVQDSAGETGRLVDALKDAFYEDQIFVDIEKLEPGVDFTEALARSLDSCDILLAIIGPEWAGRPDSQNITRIKKPDDWVRIELETALKRNIRLIPVLVSGASLPAVNEIPESLLPLLKRQTIELSNKRWKYDTEQLINFLETLGMERKKQNGPYIPPQPPAPQPAKKFSFKKLAIGALAVLGVLALIGILIDPSTLEPEPVPGPQPYHNNVIPNNPNSEPDPKNVELKPMDELLYESRVTGVWQDASGLFNVHIQQNGDQLDIRTINFQGRLTGSGSGSINGNNVQFRINFTDGGYSTGSGMLVDQTIQGNCSGEVLSVPFAEPFYWTKN